MKGQRGSAWPWLGMAAAVGVWLPTRVAASMLLVATVTASPVYFPSPTRWEERPPTAVGLEPDVLADALAELEAASGNDGTRQTVLVIDGYLVHVGAEAHISHNVWSVTKGFTSTVAGLLIADGTITLDEPVAIQAPFLGEMYPEVTYRHLLTMTSGYDARGPNRWGSTSADWSMTPYDPAMPLFAPGSAFAYWDEAMMLLTRALTAAAGQELRAWLQARVTDRIGLGAWDWWGCDYLDGTLINNGGTGVEMSPLQLARFGLLFARRGNWAGEAVVPTTWIDEATVVQVPADLPLADTDRKGSDGRGLYGYNWWLAGIREMGTRGIPSLPVGSFYGSGHNHNMLFVVPAWDLVFVRMGIDGNPEEDKRTVYERFFRTLRSGLARSANAKLAPSVD